LAHDHKGGDRDGHLHQDRAERQELDFVLRFVVHRHSTHDGGDSIHLPSFSLGRSNAVAADPSSANPD
jgi:hypothetical protein